MWQLITALLVLLIAPVIINHLFCKTISQQSQKQMVTNDNLTKKGAL